MGLEPVDHRHGGPTESVERNERAEQVRQAFQFALQRDPTASESATFVNLANTAGLAAVCRALFNCNEFLFVD